MAGWCSWSLCHRLHSCWEPNQPFTANYYLSFPLFVFSVVIIKIASLRLAKVKAGDSQLQVRTRGPGVWSDETDIRPAWIPRLPEVVSKAVRETSRMSCLLTWACGADYRGHQARPALGGPLDRELRPGGRAGQHVSLARGPRPSSDMPSRGGLCLHLRQQVNRSHAHT